MIIVNQVKMKKHDFIKKIKYKDIIFFITHFWKIFHQKQENNQVLIAPQFPK